MSKDKLNRRGFLKALGTIGAVAVVGPAFIGPVKQVINGVWEDELHGVGTEYQDYSAENVIFTACQQCNSTCTIKAVMVAGSAGGAYSSIVRKISGNQYSPLGMVPYGHINYETPLKEAIKGTGDVAKGGRGFRGARTCLKGQAGIQTSYDAFRIQHPLKRVGERGSGVWKTVTWEEAYKEILEGSKDLKTPGLKEIWAYAPEEAVMADWEKVKAGEMEKSAFDNKYKDVLINTDHPDLGPKANQIAIMAGHRRDFIERLANNSIGTASFYDHGGYCGITSVMGNVRSFDSTKQKKRMIPDYEKAEYVLVWGTNPLTANRGPTTFAPQITNAIDRGMKMVVIDPRYSKTAEKAHMWVPVKPGGDGALAMALCRWIIENGRYDEMYLRNPNEEAAHVDNEPTWSDATYLVNVGDKKRPFLRAKDLGLGEEEFVVLENGNPVIHAKASNGDLEVDTVINGIKVKSTFTIFKEKVMEKTLEEYSTMCEVPIEQIVQIAKEFTSHGKKVGIHAYRGPAMHTNGYYSGRAINLLNHLVGNHDWAGGDTALGAKFKNTEGRYDLMGVPNANKAWGIPVTRHKTPYEKTTLFAKDGYPAKRPWYPLGNKLINDVLPSSAEGYPYKIRAIIMNRTSPIMSGPRSDMQEKFLKDPKVVELVVSSDIVIGESSKYADFILPDLSYLESWNTESIFPIIKYKFASIIQPVTRIVPDARPTEQVYIDLLKGMGLPGVGDQAFTDGSSCHCPEDYYLKMVANIAFDGKKPVKDADAEELAIFEKARKNALGKFFDISTLQNAVKPEEWKKVVYVLNRGGRYEPQGDEHVGPHIKYQWANLVHFYDEKAAGFKSAYTGKFFEGVPIADEIRKYNGEVYKPTKPLQFINWKSRNMGTHRTEGNAWLREIRDENYLWVNPVDAKEKGIVTGDEVYIKSTSAKEKARVLVTPGIKPGVVGANFSFGHFAYGSTKEKIDGKVMKPAERYGHLPFEINVPMHEESGYARGRGQGFSVNALADKDDSYFEGYLADLLIGGPAQQDVFVDIKKI
ncbi:molybdopterin-dependent oxidoreductase [Robertmurraya andreesenii]|uniref:Anaerobic selenocysteine-containing dehydrogenase n=1 Tax=Anoxybacillus andreesenii TaxID=1325932 RepID=A0ABT9UYJ3_9BACL|nr:molybdopterin-dependent oxidoreductase [Robertmurraya andreesenii]MDQ0153770.1 anaerobic selenocysteine-containing dehydrogenase [Robertmurraya andreesenii]